MKPTFFLTLAVPLYAALVGVSCSPALFKETTTPTLPGQLTLYSTITPSSTSKPPDRLTRTPRPSPDPTPRTHKVKPGEDMGGIAYKYGITLKALMQANPKVTVNAMSVGTILIIPNSSNSPVTQNILKLPTPVGVILRKPACFRSAEGGLECFILVENPLDTPVENIGARITLLSLTDSESVSQIALPPLNLVPAGDSMPLLAYFPPDIPPSFHASADLLSAQLVTKNNNRYLPVKIDSQEITILSNGLSAEVSGVIGLTTKRNIASQVWVAGIAYNENGNVIGARRWESALPLAYGKTMPFALRIYAQEGKIDKVVVLIEARS